MTFQCDGKSYDTGAMRRFDTCKAHEPALFTTEDYELVFLQTMSRDYGVQVHRADAAEVGRLWRDYASPELARVLGLRVPRPMAGLSDAPPTGNDKRSGR